MAKDYSHQRAESSSEYEEVSDDGSTEEFVVRTSVRTISSENKKIVEWPPKDGRIKRVPGESVTVSYSTAKYEQATAPQPPPSREAFRPSKLRDDRWKPAEEPIQKAYFNQPKRALRKIEDIIDTTGHKTFASYHTPPGTTRTNKAHQMYEKHLKTTL